jgi:hypothetical protein
MAKKSTAEALLKQWDRWLDLIYEDFRGLVIRRRVYEEVRTIIQSNPRINKPSSFYDFMGATFAAFAAIAVRRLRDASMKRLISSIEKNAQLLSRERFVEVYATKILAGRKPTRRRASGGGAYVPSAAEVRVIANRVFDGCVGPGAAHLDPARVHADAEELREKADRLEKFARTRIAHLLDEPTDIPTLPELDAFIETFERVVKKYMMLLRATAPDVLPHWQYDWKAIFKEPWIRGSAV